MCVRRQTAEEERHAATKREQEHMQTSARERQSEVLRAQKLDREVKELQGEVQVMQEALERAWEAAAQAELERNKAELERTKAVVAQAELERTKAELEQRGIECGDAKAACTLLRSYASQVNYSHTHAKAALSSAPTLSGKNFFTRTDSVSSLSLFPSLSLSLSLLWCTCNLEHTRIAWQATFVYDDSLTRMLDTVTILASQV
jgi:hypothetical protein